MSTDTEDLTIRDLLSRQVPPRPQTIALLAPGRLPLHYGPLLVQIDAVAAALRTLGIGRHDRVAIVLPNGPEMAVAFLGVASAATSAPLNPSYHADEFEFYLSDLQAKALIALAGVDSPCLGAATARGIPVLRLAPLAGAAAGCFALNGPAGARAAPPTTARGDDVALVLHTSGTTSRPKLVPLTHANLCASALNVRDALALREQDRCLNVMPLFHIHGLVAATLASLAAGASLVCAPEFAAPRFFEWLGEFTPTWYTAVPTMHQAILAQAAQHRGLIARCPLRLIRSSSASLPPQVMAELESVFGAPVIEAYGMTEAAHQMASNPLPPRVRKPGSVGLAAGPEIEIMDEPGNLLPHGQVGDVVIRGRNVTTGYAANPAANATAFTNGWFRTGDQGALDEEGYLTLTGRLKEIINRGGEKITPRQIDEVLLNHPAVRHAVAFAVPHPTLGEDLAAAVVLRDGQGANEVELREFALAHLPAFKVPSRIVILNEIPKGPTGKVQRIGLAGRIARELSVAYDPPEEGLEQLAASTFAEVLRVQRVGRHDNFFALGGDSLRAMQAVARLAKALDAEIPPITVFRRPTAALLAIDLARLREEQDLDALAAELRKLPAHEVADLLRQGTPAEAKPAPRP